MSYSGKIAKHDEAILMLDEYREPIIECEYRKRSECNSFYIKLYNDKKLKVETIKKYIDKIMLQENVDLYTVLLTIKDIIGEDNE